MSLLYLYVMRTLKAAPLPLCPAAAAVLSLVSLVAPVVAFLADAIPPPPLPPHYCHHSALCLSALQKNKKIIESCTAFTTHHTTHHPVLFSYTSIIQLTYYESQPSNLIIISKDMRKKLLVSNFMIMMAYTSIKSAVDYLYRFLTLYLSFSPFYSSHSLSFCVCDCFLLAVSFIFTRT